MTSPLALSEFPALCAAVDGQVPDGHVFTRMLAEHADWPFLRWLDRRYNRVFSSDRIEWEGGRRESLCRQLRDPQAFWNVDAEIHMAATILSSESTSLRANDESGAGGIRKSDYLLLHPRQIDIEVRILQERNDEQTRARVSRAIVKRLNGLERNGYSITVAVEEVWNADKMLVVTPDVEKQLAQVVQRVLRAKPQHKECVIVRSDGIPMQWDGGSLHGTLIRVDIAPSKLKIVLDYGGLRAPPGALEAAKALKKKLSHKQRSGNCPWIVVLDCSNAMMDFEEVEQGCMSGFHNSQSLSAVVIQRRRVMLDGHLPDPNSSQTILFESRLLMNPNARFSITQEECAFFSAVEDTRFPNGSVQYMEQ